MATPQFQQLGQSLATLADVVEDLGDAPAVIQFGKEKSEEWSGRRLGDWAKRLAEGLRKDDLKPGETVLLFSPASPALFVAALAIFRAGGILAPIDVQTSDENMTHVLKDCGAKRIFTTRRLARRLEKVKAADSLRRHVLDGEDDEPDSWKILLADEPGNAVELDPEDPAVLFYTSGTTGLPKGVPLSHRNVLFQLETVEKTGLISREDRILVPLPLHHVYPVVLGVIAPLAMGVPIVLPHALTGGGVTRALREAQATVVLGVPRLYRAIFEGLLERVRSSGRIRASVFSLLLAIGRISNRLNRPLGKKLFGKVHERIGPSIRLLASGGSPLEPRLAENLEAIGWPVAIGYGLTETSPLLTVKGPGERRYRSVGTAVPGVELMIDPEVLPEGAGSAGNGRSASARPQGELLARGPNVFSGYHNLQEETDKAFSGGWFRTGDMAAIDAEDYLYLHGRVSTMIVLEGGENIDPEKVEAAYEECPEIEEIGILEENGKLACLVVPAKPIQREHGEEECGKRLRNAIQQRAKSLPSYQRLFRVEVQFKPLERTRLGKLQRQHLAKDFEAAKEGKTGNGPGGPVSEEDMSSEARVLMEDEKVRTLWKMLVRRFPDKPLSPDARLEFDLGVDSLDWVNLSLAIEDELKIPVDDSWLERLDTVQDLMGLVADQEKTSSGRSKRPVEEPEAVLSKQEQMHAKPRGAISTAVFSLFFLLLKLLTAVFFRLESRGLERVPRAGPYLLMPNHVSFLDSPALAAALGFERARRCFWAGVTDILFSNMLWRTISRLAQVVPIERERGPIRSLSYGALVLKRKQPLVWYPEARLSREGDLQPFRQGIVLLLEQYPVPVIPVYLQGTREALPPERWLPRPAKITVHFGEPINPKDLMRDAPDRKTSQERSDYLAESLRDLVAELRDATRK